MTKSIRFSVVPALLAGVLALAACSYESSLSGLSCEQEGAREGDRVCQDGYWVDEGAVVDGGDDTVSDANDTTDVIPDTSDTGDTQADTDADDCVPTTTDETTCDQIDNDCDGEIDEGLTTTYYFDADGDSYGDPLQSVDRCDPPAGNYVENGEDCNDDNEDVNPGITDGCLNDGSCEFCNGRDDNCDGKADEECPCDPEETPEQDCFPYGSGDPDVGPCRSGTQQCIDGTFDQCTGSTGPEMEICDGIDNDCDGDVDEGVKTTYYIDNDGDGVGSDSDTVEACSVPDGYADIPGDCDDSVDTTYPGASETCNGVDDDCDTEIDEGVLNTYYHDDDNDGFGDPNDSQEACSPPNHYVDDNTDCNDNDDKINPGEDESCNGKDDDCDTMVDEGVQTTYYLDNDGDNWGQQNMTQMACSKPDGYSDKSGDCDDTDDKVNPDESESCNGVDDDCDTDVDEGVKDTFYADSDGDTYGDPNNTTQACSAPQDFVDNSDDCDDQDPDINPDGTETCNQKDDNCNGDVDEGVTTEFYADTDGDTYGDSGNTTQACSAPTGYVSDDTDCDDGDPNTHPGATDICDGRDNDCQGGVDDGNKARDWCRDKTGNNAMECADDTPDDLPCCEIAGDGDDICEFESTCYNGEDDDDDNDVDCADSDCDGAWCADGKTCQNGTCQDI